MADLIGRMLGGGGLPDITKPSGGPWQRLGGFLGAGLGAGFASPAQAGTTTSERAIGYFRTGAGIEGTLEYAESLAGKLATFADQPTVRDSLIEASEKKLKKWGKALVIALTKSQLPIDPTLLSPAGARATYTAERGIMEQARPGMGELTPEQLRAWTGAYEPSMRMQGFAGAPEFRPELKTEEERREWERLAGSLFGGRVPIGARGAAGRMARREPPGEPSPRYAAWTGKMELGQVPANEQDLVVFLTEGIAGLGEFGKARIDELARDANTAVLYKPTKRKEGMTLPEMLGYKDMDDFDPEWIKGQPLVSRFAALVHLINSIRMSEDTMGYIFQRWFEDLLGPAASTPAYASLPGFEPTELP